MDPDGPGDSVPPGPMPTGPHPVAGPHTVRMPGWPGPVLAIGGILLLIGPLVLLEVGRQGGLPTDAALLGWIAILGGLLFVCGLLWAAVRQVKVRAHLAPERYRGPSVFLLIAFVLVITNVLALPFAEDILVITLGEGELTLLGSVVVLVSTQLALLVVTWLFVVRPRALAGLAVPGPNTAGAVFVGLRWGIGAWLLATIVSAVVVLVLDALGIEAAPQTAAQALGLIEPWLAVVALVIAAPVAEEVFFRGVVFNAWRREAGRLPAYLGSALLFGVIHLSLAAFVPIVLLGLILAWVYERTRNIVAPIVLHAVFNGINVAVFLLQDAGVIQLPT